MNIKGKILELKDTVQVTGLWNMPTIPSILNLSNSS